MSNEQDPRSDEAVLGPPSSHIVQRFNALMSQMPEPFSGADENDTPDPQPGQFWTARWNDLSTAVLLLSSPGARTVSMSIVTFDPDLADDHSYVLPAEATDLNTSAVAWTADAQRAPLAVLDTYLGRIAQSPGSGKSHAVAQWIATAGEQGSPFTRPSDSRAIFRASLRDDLEELVQASWLTAPTAASSTTRVSERSPTELADELGISIPEALSMKRGTTVPTAEQMAMFADLQAAAADASPSLAHSVSLPEAVIDLFDLPRYRQKVAKLAKLRDLDENVARQAFAYNVFSTAARNTGDDRSDEAGRELWRQRVEQFFAVQLEELGEDE